MAAAPTDPTSLQNLYDIITPAPVPWWPPAPGWYVVGGALLVLAVWAGWRWWRHWQAAAYRRAALRELQQLKTRTADNVQRVPALQELPALVKRTALVAFPRQQVASLSSTAWLEFLDRTGHTDAFTRGRGQLLPVLSYDPRAASRLAAQDMAELFRVVSRGGMFCTTTQGLSSRRCSGGLQCTATLAGLHPQRPRLGDAGRRFAGSRP